MIGFEWNIFNLTLYGLSAAGFLVGAVWGYLQSVRNDDVTFVMAVWVLFAGVLCGCICFYVTGLLLGGLSAIL